MVSVSKSEPKKLAAGVILIASVVVGLFTDAGNVNTPETNDPAPGASVVAERPAVMKEPPFKL